VTYGYDVGPYVSFCWSTEIAAEQNRGYGEHVQFVPWGWSVNRAIDVSHKLAGLRLVTRMDRIMAKNLRAA